MLDEKKLLELYVLASAPLTNASQLGDIAELSPSDFTLDALLDELKLVQKFSNVGLQSFIDILTPVAEFDQTVVDRNDSVGTALLYAGTYAKRLATLAASLHLMALNTLDRGSSEPSKHSRNLEAEVKASTDYIEKIPAKNVEKIVEFLDLTPNVKWCPLEAPLKNKVGFNAMTAVISDGKVEEIALKETTTFNRRKQRNPTGYLQFTFKDDSDIDSESRPSHASSTKGGSTDGGSTRGSISQHGAGAAGNLTSRSASSGGEDLDEEDDMAPNPFSSKDRSLSSVVFSFDRDRELIQDPAADPQWDERERHESRFSRIRNRVPTGHPSLMKRTSDELAGLVNDYEKQLSHMNLDDTTAENTETNKTVKLVGDDETDGAAVDRDRSVKKKGMKFRIDEGA